MLPRLIIVAFAGLPAASCAATPAPPMPAAPPVPARVLVAFDRDTITPLVVEGLADRESARPVTANDPARVASISKLVMALTALRLAEDGVVDLDADISQYLGWRVRAPGFPQAPVTLRQLLEHRSGLRDAGGYVVPLGESLEAKLADPASWVSDAPPGEAPFAYANLGSPVVATVLEAASGERFDQLAQRIVFDPLGIEACFNWVGCSAATRARGVVLYRDSGEIAADSAEARRAECRLPVAEGTSCRLADYVPGTNASIFSPQGGLRIGLVDLAKIGQALANGGGGIVSTSTLEEFYASAQPTIEGQEYFCSYGLGVQRIEQEGRTCVDDLFSDGITRFGHPGEAYGLRSGLWFDPQSGTGIAYYLTAVPARVGAEDSGGFDERVIRLVQQARRMGAER